MEGWIMTYNKTPLQNEQDILARASNYVVSTKYLQQMTNEILGHMRQSYLAGYQQCQFDNADSWQAGYNEALKIWVTKYEEIKKQLKQLGESE